MVCIVHNDFNVGHIALLILSVCWM